MSVEPKLELFYSLPGFFGVVSHVMNLLREVSNVFLFYQLDMIIDRFVGSISTFFGVGGEVVIVPGFVEVVASFLGCKEEGGPAAVKTAFSGIG